MKPEPPPRTMAEQASLGLARTTQNRKASEKVPEHRVPSVSNILLMPQKTVKHL